LQTGFEGVELSIEERPISRKGAKHRKVAKQRKNFAFAFLRAFATLRELFWFSRTFGGFPQIRRQSRSFPDFNASLPFPEKHCLLPRWEFANIPSST